MLPLGPIVGTAVRGLAGRVMSSSQMTRLGSAVSTFGKRNQLSRALSLPKEFMGLSSQPQGNQEEPEPRQAIDPTLQILSGRTF